MKSDNKLEKQTKFDARFENLTFHYQAEHKKNLWREKRIRSSGKN
jgi:hypothetical protein